MDANRHEPSRKEHWENIYRSKQDLEVSWYQPVPETSLELIAALELPPDAGIIDIGAGNSNLAAILFDRGCRDLTVLDISGAAIERARAKTGAGADSITWLTADVLTLDTPKRFDLWHDRAVFHFFTDPGDIRRYVAVAHKHVKPGGCLIISTFSETGPKKCSGLDVTQYSETSLARAFGSGFRLLQSLHRVHTTPFQTTQDFICCLLQKQV